MRATDFYTSRRLLFALSALLVVFDQLTKALVREHLDLFERIELLPVLSLVRLHNSGMAFGLFDLPGGVQLWIITPVAFIVSAFLVREIWLARAPDGARAFAFALVLAGALGNLIDRVSLGHVVDFVLMHAFGWAFPAYNLADVCITFGVGAWAWSIFRETRSVSSAFSLVEVMIVVLIVAVLAAITVPIYVGFTNSAARTAAEGDLLRCGARIERRLLDGDSLEAVADSDGDGVGDAATGAIASALCTSGARDYHLEMAEAEGSFFVLHAVPEADSDLPLLAYDADGNTLIDRDQDGDFDGADERIW